MYRVTWSNWRIDDQGVYRFEEWDQAVKFANRTIHKSSEEFCCIALMEDEETDRIIDFVSASKKTEGESAIEYDARIQAISTALDRTNVSYAHVLLMLEQDNKSLRAVNKQLQAEIKGSQDRIAQLKDESNVQVKVRSAFRIWR